MIGGERIAKKLKKYPEIKICFVGSHVSALPREVLALDYVDYILLNEGVYALIDLLSSDFKNLEKIEGIGFK